MTSQSPSGTLPGTRQEGKIGLLFALGAFQGRQGEFWGRPGPLREAGERPKGGRGEAPGAQGPPTGLQEPFWSDFGPAGERFGPNFDRCQQHLRGNLLLHLRGAWAEPRRTAQRRSRKSCRKKLSKKSSKPSAGQMCRAHVPLAVVVDLRRSNG